MGLFNALNAAVSGLQAQSFAMQNISGNIANAQTVAYKGISTSFLDLVPGDSVPSKQVAGGVIASSRATNTVQGTIQATESSTDIAINGNGYFQVQAASSFNGGSPVFNGVNYYTRRGDFHLDADGYMVNGAGYYLEGIPIDPLTGVPSGSVASPLQFNSNFLPPSATSQITYALNLPTVPHTNNYNASTADSELMNAADFTVDPTTGGTGTVVGNDLQTFVDETIDGGSITAYDATGNPANIQFRWGKTDSVAAGGTDTWQLFYQTDSTATGATVGWVNAGQDFVFDSNGQLNPAITNFTLTGVSVDGTSLGNLSVSSPTGSVSQYANVSGLSTVNNLQQNGYAAGELQTIQVNDTGDITGTFSNGQTVPLAYIPLVHFNSPDNLKGLDGGAYQATEASGPPLAGASGSIIGQSLEASNTDIATEFTKLIVTQQAYSANTKVVTTANQMSQDLLNIIR